jgi:hypothetical protein
VQVRGLLALDGELDDGLAKVVVEEAAMETD